VNTFVAELQRRKVYRVAVAYIIAAGFIIQIGSAVFPAWELPNWTFRLVVVFLLIGFPISLILAWAYDVTPQGIRATPAPGAHRRRNLIVLIVIGVVVSAIAGFFILPRALARKIDKSIAVMPFENLSEDKENAHFADGIQDDILTNLAKIGDMKVISRLSVMAYRDAPHNAREIGKALGVSTILEGMLYRYQGDKVRAQAAFDRARVIAEQLVRESPDDAARHGQLGFILAGLGRKEEAIREGKRAVELLPESQDAFDGPEATAALAQIYAWTGERDQAFSLLDHLLITPNGLTIPILKLDPVWDSLRTDPRFQALVDQYGRAT